MDITTLGGVIGALGLILLGQALEGGHVGSILQGTAALIVFGGTFGAVAVSFPLKDFVRGLKLAGAFDAQDGNVRFRIGFDVRGLELAAVL